MIEIVPYDGSWPALFESEATCIRKAMGSAVLRIEHVGSTSVPGLAAKPAIDIQVSVTSLDALPAFTEMLAQLGYQKPAARASTHHVHLCVLGCEQERRHLAFRDYLRSHPEIAIAYVAIKRSLAAAHDGATLESRERYSLAKTRFVNSVLAQALSEGYPRGQLP
jgi:GrpB-like predicted nucleotidyltransferase (UPF0157 family)